MQFGGRISTLQIVCLLNFFPLLISFAKGPLSTALRFARVKWKWKGEILKLGNDEEISKINARDVVVRKEITD